MATNSPAQLSATSSISDDVGVDTLRLYLSNYTIPHNCDLQVVSAAKLRLSGHATSWRDQPLWGAAGREVRGALAFYREEGLHVQIRPLRLGLYGPKSLACFITLSVPKRCFGYNLPPVDSRQFRGVINGVADTLPEIGIEGEVWSAKVCGIDLSRNIELNEPFEKYMPLLRCVNPPRIDRVRHFKSGVLMMNTQRTLRIYDKVAEMKRRRQRTWEMEDNLNILRAEHSWRNGKVVRKELGIETVQDLLNSHHQLENLFRDAMRQTLTFPHLHSAGPPSIISEEIDIRAIRDSMARHGAKCFKQICEDTGRRVLQKEIGEERLLQEMLSALRTPSRSRSEISKFKRWYRGGQYAQAVARDPNLLSLQDEVLSKVLRDKCLILIPSPVALPSPHYASQERTKSVAA